MKTTLNLPDDLMKAAKIRAVQEERTLQELIAELIRQGLARRSEGTSRTARRVRLPLVKCARSAKPGEQMGPDRVAEILLEDEARGSLR